jgi:hypothetical protein
MYHVHTSVEDKAVHADLLVACNAHSLYEFLFIAYCRQCTHEPAVAVVALSYIVRGRSAYEELWAVEDILVHVSCCATLWKGDSHTSTLLTERGWKSVCASLSPVKQSAGVSGTSWDRLKSASMSK